MSTHIETLKGIKESELSNEKIETTMSLTRFWGGAEKGRMLQLTVSNSDGYIQLTKEETIELAKTLLNSFDDTIYPSE
jgi:hypothetical protein